MADLIAGTGMRNARPAARDPQPAIVRVALVPAPGRLDLLDYRLPPDTLLVEPGTRVLVPIGARRSMGIVIEVVRESTHRGSLKDVLSVLDEEPVLDSRLLELARWMADYYLGSFSEALATMLPAPLKIETERQLVLCDGLERVPAGADAAVLQLLRDRGPQTIEGVRRELGCAGEKAAARLRRKGLVRVVERLRRELAPTRRIWQYEALASGDEEILARRPSLARVYAYLRDHPLGRASERELRVSFPGAAAKLRHLMASGLVRRRATEEYRTVLPTSRCADRAVLLSAAQASAVAAIGTVSEEGFRPFLLWGVTGSGKTEVYLRAAAAVRDRRQSVLILVPEISLTHQLVDRVRARFGDQIAVLHSQLSDGERWDEWRRIARREVSIVIGARSAVFAPLRDLGLIIVDEEHDGAYKQADGLRYNGRDVAILRAKLAACPVVLGSATPSMESFHNARSGRYRLLELPERVESRPLPEVKLVDLRDPQRRAPTVLSPPLQAALSANLAAGGQSLVFLNRRGFAHFLQCRACGDPISCPNCSVTLTWHERRRALRCHYCDHTVGRPPRCPACGDGALETWGTGTERVESLLREAHPGARVARMDRDTTQRKGSQRALLDAWARGRLDMLVGTQMVTKGHDIPGVTLVGVLLADLSLNFPDFRAAEQTFQLLTQVAGRAGRGARAGRVIVQTLQPHHYSLQAAARHDYAAFAEHEMEARRELEYPPFSRLVLIRIEGEDQEEVQRVASQAAQRLRDLTARRFGVLGPAPAPLERLRGRYRWQILARGRNGAVLRQSARAVLDGFAHSLRKSSVRLIVDVDPYGML